MCDDGPAMLVNEVSHVLVTPEKVHEILEQCRERFGVHATEEKKEDI